MIDPRVGCYQMICRRRLGESFLSDEPRPAANLSLLKERGPSDLCYGWQKAMCADFGGER
jgi:hypothetical protein